MMEQQLLQQQRRRMHRLPQKPLSLTATTNNNHNNTRRTVALLLATVASTTRSTVVLSHRHEGEEAQQQHLDVIISNNNDNKECTDIPEKPVYSTIEQRCVPCLNYFDNPMEPDKGCSKEKPLCVTTITSSNDSVLLAAGDNTITSPVAPSFQRPDWGRSGTECVPYPCHKTRLPQHNHNSAIDFDVDDGCSTERPYCVDAMGNDPPMHQPGMQCVARHDSSKQSNSKNKSTSTTTTSRSSSNYKNGNHGVWGVVTRKSNTNTNQQQQEREQLELQFEKELAAYGLLGRTTTTATDDKANTVNASNNKAMSCSTSSSAGKFSFCGGCPFSRAHTKTCGIATTAGSNSYYKVPSW